MWAYANIHKLPSCSSYDSVIRNSPKLIHPSIYLEWHRLETTTEENVFQWNISAATVAIADSPYASCIILLISKSIRKRTQTLVFCALWLEDKHIYIVHFFFFYKITSEVRTSQQQSRMQVILTPGIPNFKESSEQIPLASKLGFENTCCSDQLTICFITFQAICLSR